MRIGIDARTVAGRFTGDRTYWRGLLSGLSQLDADHEYFLYVRDAVPDGSDAIELGDRFAWRIVPASNDRIWSLTALPHAARSDKIDVMHVQYTVSPFFRVPVVTTIHDISFRLFPKLFSAKDRALLNISVPAAVRLASRVIGVSENTRRDILRAYAGTPPHKVVAIPLAASSDFKPQDEADRERNRRLLEARHAIRGPYVLAVGVLQPRKNLPLLIRAFRAAKRIARRPHRLVITGKHGWMTAEIDTALREAGDDVLFTGYVPDEHLPLLYGCADMMCYPSLYEGFGLPPLEAMACGCPVVVSRSSSLPEVVGEAGIMLDPERLSEWIDAIAALLDSAPDRTRLSESGLAQAAKFSWRRTAMQTLAVYNACHNRDGL
jgi:glycosyltransferase involved in cell wall biosynthesis